MKRGIGVFAVIYEIVSRIPVGRVATYGQIAMMAGRPRAARMVGYALCRAPEGLPCHRVVNREGNMAPGDIFGGQELQRHMLREEGVTFRPDGRIDMGKHLWNGQ